MCIVNTHPELYTDGLSVLTDKDYINAQMLIGVEDAG